MAGGTLEDGSASTSQAAPAGHHPDQRTGRRSRVARRAARVLLLDPADRLLLFRGCDPDRPHRTFWFTPGGGIEPGEDAAGTLRRELAEELGLTEVELGPHVWNRLAQFTFRGVDYDQREVYHLGRCAPFEIDTSGMSELERSAHLEHRWWTLEELVAAHDVFAPPDLPERLAELLTDGVPATPVPVAGSVLP
jgi:8-oxo-dGTP pyrophosphatase MutT (NUDIX family)